MAATPAWVWGQKRKPRGGDTQGHLALPLRPPLQAAACVQRGPGEISPADQGPDDGDAVRGDCTAVTGMVEKSIGVERWS